MTIATGRRVRMRLTGMAKQCAVLLIDPMESWSEHRPVLEGTGFRVLEVRDWPVDDRAVLDFEVVVVRVPDMHRAPMLAARLRAKPRFGRRVLIALAPATATLQERQSARASGFDDVLSECCGSRVLAARILRRLRRRPEYRCVLPPGVRGRPAA